MKLFVIGLSLFALAGCGMEERPPRKTQPATSPVTYSDGCAGTNLLCVPKHPPVPPTPTPPPTVPPTPTPPPPPPTVPPTPPPPPPTPPLPPQQPPVVTPPPPPPPVVTPPKQVPPPVEKTPSQKPNQKP